MKRRLIHTAWSCAAWTLAFLVASLLDGGGIRPFPLLMVCGAIILEAFIMPNEDTTQ